MKFYLCLYLVVITNSILYGQEPSCIECHSDQIQQWQQSDHFKAMAKLDDETVLGDFSDVTVNHHSQSARFYIKDSSYLIDFTEASSMKTYKVAYVFGYRPLQEYLIDIGGGKLQVFPFAWDDRDESEGGKRWYPMYPDEDIQPADRLHWLQPIQNWNGMCADCHSDGLKRNYNRKNNTFNTQWDNINTGCQSCHGKLADTHGKTEQTNQADDLKSSTEKGYWRLEIDKKVAQWHGEKRDNQFMDSCFNCHSLRSSLTDGFEFGKHYLDQHSPTLLSSPLYYADGQVREEVYVYGSFLQSKMYQAGVNCLDCHDKHSMQVKSTTNAICTQCHNGNEYDQEKHLIHKVGTSGAMCVDCHMPETTYMGVDDRRDHSFSIPRPDLTNSYGIPNACNRCHKEKSADWSLEQVKKHYEQSSQLSVTELNYIKLQLGESISLQEHFAIVNDESLSDIKRASSLALLPGYVNSLSDKDVKQWVYSPVDLIRLATAQIGFLLPPQERKKSYLQLLNDKYKAIRTHAAFNLTGPNFKSQLESLDVFQNAYNELLIATNNNSWRGEGLINLSLIKSSEQDLTAAIKPLLQSIKIDPYFEPAYVNLADLYRSLKRTSSEKETYQKGLAAIPRSGLLHYNHALFLIRQKDINNAIESLTNAVALSPDNPQFAYAYFIALDNTGNTHLALNKIKESISRYQSNQLIELGMLYARKLNDKESFEELHSQLR